MDKVRQSGTQQMQDIHQTAFKKTELTKKSERVRSATTSSQSIFQADTYDTRKSIHFQ